MRGGQEEDKQKLDLVVFLKGQWNQTEQTVFTSRTKEREISGSLYSCSRMVNQPSGDKPLWRSVVSRVRPCSRWLPNGPPQPHCWVRIKKVISRSNHILSQSFILCYPGISSNVTSWTFYTQTSLKLCVPPQQTILPLCYDSYFIFWIPRMLIWNDLHLCTYFFNFIRMKTLSVSPTAVAPTLRTVSDP